MTWFIGGRQINSRFMLGTARYPSPQILLDAIEQSGSDIITVSLRRENSQQNKEKSRFWETLTKTHANILPNTAGCHTVKEAITTAHLARDLFDTQWIKLEIIGCDETLQPDPFKTVEATRILVEEGFEVFAYTTDDLIVAERLIEAGCRIIMPWASPIGTGQGIKNESSLVSLRKKLPNDINLIVDAGIGKPSQACQAMELGFDGVLLNTAVARAQKPAQMAKAFAQAVEAGREAYLAGTMQAQQRAVPSTPVVGLPFWQQH